MAMADDLTKQVGEKIRTLRRAAGLTQDELAAQAEISGKHLGEIERGNDNVSLEYLERLAIALGVEPFELLVSGTGRRTAALRRKAAYRLIERLDPPAASFVDAVIDAYLAHRGKE
jgi:transcriptional regulator with XRE-family HTH domain